MPRSGFTALIGAWSHRTNFLFLSVYVVGPQAAVRLSKDFDKRLRRFMVRPTPLIPRSQREDGPMSLHLCYMLNF